MSDFSVLHFSYYRVTKINWQSQRLCQTKYSYDSYLVQTERQQSSRKMEANIRKLQETGIARENTPKPTHVPASDWSRIGLRVKQRLCSDWSEHVLRARQIRKMRRIFNHLRVQLSQFPWNTRLRNFQGLILRFKSFLTKINLNNSNCVLLHNPEETMLNEG